MSTIYLNGEYVPGETATVSIDDRGFLLADACYEVTACFRGRFLALDRHLTRLQQGLDELRIRFDAATLVPVHHELIARNDLGGAPASSVYVHITRGVAPRTHAFPASATPTVLARASASAPVSDAATFGVRAITHEDLRWGRVDIKTPGLLPNVLAQQSAVDAGVQDVVLHRDGEVTEGSHTNVFGVIDGAVVTAPTDHRILPGVTRALVLELARADGVRVDERVWTLDELRSADEVFMTSTNSGVRPLIEIDGRPVGNGRRGPVTEGLQASYRSFVARECGL